MSRIAFISSTYPDYKKCGTGIYAGYLTQALASLGHEVHVITSAIPEIKASHGRVQVHKVFSDWNMTELPKLFQALSRIKPEIVHINHPTTIAGGKSKFLVNAMPEIIKTVAGLPVITTLHEFPNVSKLGKLKLLPMLLSSHLITVTNKCYKEHMSRFLPHKMHDKIRIINIGAQIPEHLALTSTSQEIQRRQFGLKKEDLVLGFVGYITPPKGFHNLIKAVAPICRSNPNIKVLALSSWNLTQPHYRQEILDAIDKENIRSQVVFSGFLEEENLWHALEAIDVCVFPFDVPIEERSSGPLRQALYRGLPTICYAQDIFYNEFQLQHKENIWLTPLHDVNALQADIRNLLEDKFTREKLSAGAQKLRSLLSFDTVSNEMSRLYTELLQRPRT